MSIKHIGYKVLSNWKGKLYSAFVQFIDSPHYQVGKWTFPLLNHGPLCVFDSLKRARAFYRACVVDTIGEIYKCSYVKAKESYVYTPMKKAHVTELWNNTILASKVRLSEKVSKSVCMSA